MKQRIRLLVCATFLLGGTLFHLLTASSAERHHGQYIGGMGGGLLTSGVDWYLPSGTLQKLGSRNLSSWFVGGTFGMNHSLSECWVAGLEADGAYVDLDEKGDGTPVNEFERIEVSALITVRGRVGYVLDSDYAPMLYITGGMGTIHAKFSTDEASQGESAHWRYGWVVGGGIESYTSPCNDISLKIEYLYLGLPVESYFLNFARVFGGGLHSLKAGINKHF